MRGAKVPFLTWREAGLGLGNSIPIPLTYCLIEISSEIAVK